MLDHFIGIQDVKTIYRILICFKSFLSRDNESRNFFKEILCTSNGGGGLDLRDQLNVIIEKYVETKKVYSLAI